VYFKIITENSEPKIIESNLRVKNDESLVQIIREVCGEHVTVVDKKS